MLRRRKKEVHSRRTALEEEAGLLLQGAFSVHRRESQHYRERRLRSISAHIEEDWVDNVHHQHRLKEGV